MVSYLWILPLLFTCCVGWNPPETEAKINAFIAKWGVYVPPPDPPVGSASEDHVFGDDGRCLMKADPGFTPFPITECCKKPYGHYEHHEVDGYCRSSSCSVFGYPTNAGLTCDCLSCDCIHCVWDNEKCFTSPDWHRNRFTGELDPVDGRHCFGQVHCKPNNQGIIPANCEDIRVGQYCLEIPNASTPILVGNETGDRTPWMTTFRACGNYLCNNDTDCCGDQICNITSGVNVNSCDKCNYTGICSDPPAPPGPKSSPFPSPEPCVECDDRWRNEECKAAVCNHKGWHEVDINNCGNFAEAYDDLLKNHSCSKVAEDCETWICESFITDEELIPFTKCQPKEIECDSTLSEDPNAP